MKFSKSISMIPLALAIGNNAFSSVKTNFVFNEEDLIKNFITINQDLIKDSKRDAAFMADDQYIAIRLRGFIDNWRKETKFSSSISKIVQNANFKNILSLGRPAVPAILNEIHFAPSNLVWALNYIEGFNISKTPMTIDEACKKWVKWGFNNHLIK